MVFYLPAAAQQPVQEDKKKDSLLAILKKSKEDTLKILTLCELGVHASDSKQFKEVFEAGNQMMALSQKLDFKRGVALSHYILALYYYYSSKPKETYENISLAMELLEKSWDKEHYGKSLMLQIQLSNSMGNGAETQLYSKKALPLYEELKWKEETGEVYSYMANSFFYTGDYPQELEQRLKEEKIAEELNDSVWLASVYNSIANVFVRQGEDSIAIEYLNRSVEISKRSPDRENILNNSYYLLARIDAAQGRYDQALDFFFRMLKKDLARNRQPPHLVWLDYYNIGSIIEKRGDSAMATGNTIYGRKKYSEALDYVLKAYNGYCNYYDTIYPVTYGRSAGSIYMKLGNTDQAGKILMAGLKQSKKLGAKDEIAAFYLVLSQTDSISGNYKMAYEYYKLHKLYYDSVYNTENSRLFNQLKTQADFEKKEKEMGLLAAENKLKTSLANQQKQKRKFAYALSSLILIGSGYGVYRYRKFSKQKSEQRRLKERLAISQDLHDHVGSTLSSISVFSKVAQVEGEKGNTSQMNELLDRIRNTSGKMMTEMNDIVWAINPQNDTMEKIIQRMESFARPLLTARNIQFLFNYDEAVKSLNLEMEQRKNFFLIFKEAVNNAIKYSGGSLLEASILYRQGLLELSVKDNGVGFNLEKEMNETKSLSGNGLKNMIARSKAMNASLMVESTPGKGTLVRLVCPFM